MTRRGILLIGGTGFLGTALARTLAADDREVHVLARGVEPGQRAGIRYHCGSQDEALIVAPLLKTCDTVVHLAANSTPGSASASLLSEIEQNLLPTARLLGIMESTPPARLLFISSGGSLYGNPQHLPVGEQHGTSPISCHAAGKVSQEAFFTTFAHSHNTSLAVLRPSNLYGPGQPLRAGFGIVRTILEKARRGDPIEIRGDGSAVRDYLYIDDAVDACRRLIDTPQATGPYNAGSGSGVSIATLIRLCRETTDRTIPVIHQSAPNTDVRAIVLDSSRLAEETGWKAEMALSAGIARTWRWLTEGF
ncbi:MAG TPA: NAD-dependent epimerase/dehydratase family protein [Pseudomonas sp.]|nr:NAD-dependent epimerase/dehydratase family protein [Pseudomonas sp.]